MDQLFGLQHRSRTDPMINESPPCFYTTGTFCVAFCVTKYPDPRFPLLQEGLGEVTHVTKVPAPRVARKKPAPCGAGLGMVCFHLLSHIEPDRV